MAVCGELKLMEAAPSLLTDDINANINDLTWCTQWMKGEDWIGVRGVAHLCLDGANQPTCQVNARARATRRDVVLANQLMTPAIVHFNVCKSKCSRMVKMKICKPFIG